MHPIVASHGAFHSAMNSEDSVVGRYVSLQCDSSYLVLVTIRKSCVEYFHVNYCSFHPHALFVAFQASTTQSLFVSSESLRQCCAVICLLSAMVKGSASAASDDAGLSGNLSQPVDTAGLPQNVESSAKRLCLRRADYVGTQIFQPHGPSPIEKAPLADLWDVVRRGNKYTEFYSYLAHSDHVRQGVAISQCAQTLKHAIRHFREGRVQLILQQSIYEKVKKVTDELWPHLEVLDGGYNQKRTAGGFAKLSRPISTKSEEDVDKACRAVHAWLSQSMCPFRAYLQIMSGSGVVYAAQCEEKVLRAYVVCDKVAETVFADAAKSRLCTDAGAALEQASQDDLALTQA